MPRFPRLPRGCLPAPGTVPVLLVAAALLVPAMPAQADVYTWRDPQTGRKRMSNIPPRWVLENAVGPRVEVIRGNTVIDVGTSIAKPQEPAQPSAAQRALGAAAAAVYGRTVEVQPPPEPDEGD